MIRLRGAQNELQHRHNGSRSHQALTRGQKYRDNPILFGTAGATDVVWDVVPRRLLSVVGREMLIDWRRAALAATRSGAE